MKKFLQFLVITLALGNFQNYSVSAQSATSDAEAKKQLRLIVEQKLEEIGRAKGVIEQLEKDVALTSEALDKAKRKRFRGYFVWGVPAVGLLAATYIMGRASMGADPRAGDYGFGMMFKIISGVTAVVTGAGAAGTGYILYLRMSDVVKIRKSLELLNAQIVLKKDELNAKQLELEALRAKLKD